MAPERSAEILYIYFFFFLGGGEGAQSVPVHLAVHSVFIKALFVISRHFFDRKQKSLVHLTRYT